DYLVRGKTAVRRQTHRSPATELLGRCRCRPLRKNPVRADEMAGVAVGVLLEVVLMLGLGLPERARRGDFRHDLPGPAPPRLDLGNRLLGDAALFLVAVEDRRAVARPEVVALPVERRRIVDAEEELEHVAVRGALRVEDDLDRLRMAAMASVRRVRDVAAAVADSRRDHARLLPEQMLHPPEAPAGEEL